MIKGKEALLSLKEEYYIENDEHIIVFNADDDRLKAIEEDIEDLNLIKEICDDYCIDYNLVNIREALFTFAQLLGEHGAKWKNYNKKLEALEIIKEKRVDVHYLQECKNLKQYNDSVEMNWSCRKEAEYHNEILTQEEFNLLKELVSWKIWR